MMLEKHWQARKNKNNKAQSHKTLAGTPKKSKDFQSMGIQSPE
jgi:hypothetical protein